MAAIYGEHDRFVCRLVSSEYSSETTRLQGSTTKTDNGYAQRLLVKTAWHHRREIYHHPGRVMHT